ncbi:clathrin interactor 1-like [Paramacrobiotus metropolitanus]|uniref:clathrin interactor 1-like n=1 Tax=Paramacrobiotus metropolitanus TaxID=2943436 RepID=UPI002446127F|nr:clathrin interactor 1-like [Paramacrobiotus metropolitanus]
MFSTKMWKIREITDQVVNMVMNYTEVEAKVREATNEDPWGPTGPQMQELSQYTYSAEHYHEVMSMLWKRMLVDNKTSWRRVYKSLLLLGYMLRNGAERVVTSGKEHLFDLRSLEHYKFVDEVGKDQGINVRNRVKEMLDLLQDDARLRDERKKARKSRDKYVGLSADDAAMTRRRGHQSSQSNRASWSPSDSPTSSRRQPDSDVEEERDPRYEFHDEGDGDDVENHDRDSNSNGRSSGTSRPSKQIKPIGKRIGAGQEKSEPHPKPRASDSDASKTEVELPRPPSQPTSHGKDLMSDFGDFGDVAVDAGNNVGGKPQDDWADFASFRGAPPENKAIDASPDDFVEGLTKLHFTKSFKAPGASGPADSDLLNEFGDFSSASTPSMASGLPATQQYGGMPHSLTMPALAPHAVTPQQVAGLYAMNAGNPMMGMPQSQSMNFQQMQQRPPMGQPSTRPPVMPVFGASAQPMGPIGYQFNSGPRSAPPTPRQGPTTAVSTAPSGTVNWGNNSGGNAGLNIELDLNLAKNYNKPYSPPMNQLIQNPSMSNNPATAVRPGFQYPPSPGVQGQAPFGAFSGTTPQLAGNSVLPQQQQQLQAQSSKQLPFGDLL